MRNWIEAFRGRGLSKRAKSAVTTSRRKTLLNPDLQHQFEEFGFVVVDLIDHTTVSVLRERYDSMDHEQRTQFDWVDGFDTSIYDQRPEYRAQVFEVMEELITPALSSVLDDYRLMFANFIVKYPNSDWVPPHVDWTFLDEQQFSSVTVWCPLVDTNAANGTLGVVSGSHRRIDFLRPSNVPTYERCELAVADIEDRPVISVKAGQAIIMDNRVVHFSPPNTTESNRIAVGCVVGPSEAELHHYWMNEDAELMQFHIDRSFYLSYVIGNSPTTAGGVLGATVVQ
ncbi:MAG: phytanoyl-CoA dioxygenase family protein [Microthrixaceae bacterium]